MEWINILIVVASFFVSALIIILLSAIYLNIAEAVKKNGDFSIKNQPKPPKRRLVSKCEYEEKTDYCNATIADLKRAIGYQIVDAFYAKETPSAGTFSIKVVLKDFECEKCQRIKELEAKVKALEIELEGVI